ncbi:CDP-diacylglycerol--glycerol-3-phosphate 3-phosphatidyltransferase [Clostridium thermosuccinogenes]|uniref:CDP-diacylglycerol--glycerol-3-phosphate 3-phosphatidyltransferase n=1 Tax=Clostridium thermosuccinogenes TaxID=84032 RepID=A0A2K2FG93_9CLOT|nr:CDP-diacylglycerol--glycerol-3-phosphate 3-phosphatidyltransferase [Pseudoclostridium thermosuccinogenes]AUS96452.1 CDP-diacylglycerol--glycerol-3-phosphate 3-phosphatidyltransferase [Pseudoclostridium thermosuccinogenes]PNT92883.1 CDP-diacylglycerol--glycerol-3-phosphate 3-phosphatidyltransferase [Pseudoclostridium thermosuccinogenes]PNT97776.1 CDP-diacylglycerol--glycerol-3-phosphate 3-phosphatidyltransferase [Pseudoclostridium thermosuccinogenes]PNT99766.1 CDP-diacylglycerol--glycerol-3-p
MNLPNKITLGRILLVPVFMFFVVPIPDWVVKSSMLGFMHNQLEALNDFIINYGNFIGAVIFIIASSTDGVDGHIARKRNMITKLGIFLDPIADKLLTAAALIALVQRYELTGHGVSSWTAMIIISRELIITGFRLVAAGEGLVLSASKLGKLKTATQMVAITVSLLNNLPFSLFTNIAVDRYLMFIAVIITVYSGYDYIAKNRQVLRTGNEGR